jgi:hypothetical protein
LFSEVKNIVFQRVKMANEVKDKIKVEDENKGCPPDCPKDREGLRILIPE